MNALVEILSKDTVRTVILIGVGVLFTKISQAKKIKGETPVGPIDVEF